MQDHEKYLFDLRGYIVVKNVLSSSQIADLSARLEEERKTNPRPILGSDRTIFRNEDDPAWSAPSLLEMGGTYLELIDLPVIKPYLTTLLGNHFRLDHDYVKVDGAMKDRTLYLHGGGQGAGGPKDLVGPTDGGQCYYRYSNGKFYNGLVAVAFELDTVNPSDGGFACVPGSHKSNIGLPSEWRIAKTQAEMPEIVERVAVSAGDAIIFTEACSHGTVPWTGEGERRTIFYKYCPHAIAWSPCYYNADNYGGLTEAQREILLPPSAYGPHKATRYIWERAQAEQSELRELRAKKTGPD
ncbi:MAG TPA: mitomycin antibiotics/polyketide fumonisin biosynthesis protein [Gammaproteobacteria bacterium]|nr:mitomycin antibiotics/polyketide fumonisin biosynthesis protein [Gammaproteobacteria bacterium]|tara:strand:- start:1668 stop:2561 length:894 start_codon:yes stop_codon:yes gene_type:complete